jgi:galactokinase
MNKMTDYKRKFQSIFKSKEKIKHYYSPGRVNLIGEHIDYNGGLVFPAAISIGTHGYVGKRNDLKICLFSANYPNEGIIEVDLSDLSFKKEHGWANYAKGILNELIVRGYSIPFGFNLYVDGNLPTASGLSSSASLEVLVAYIANDLYILGLTRVEIALLAQDVENGYMGMHCGIMDQLIISCGIKDHALLMNTATLEMTPSKAKFEGYDIVIMNTNYKRKTTDSKYNERVHECSTALKQLQFHFQIDYLCDIKPEELLKIETIIKDKTLIKRVRHVVTEQHRVITAINAMKKGDVKLFGSLLNGSHESLKNDYEVTGLHLDLLVKKALIYGAIGARVTGAGFGGCAIALVKSELVDQLIEKVGHDYLEETKIVPDFYQGTFEDGVHMIEND